jgi:multidrug efflux system outer membrane protein
LAQRPDLAEAERKLQAASEGIRAARAELLPTFNIEGDAGTESAHFDQAFEGQSRTWMVAGTVSIPIFEGDRNVANLRAAHARQEEALAAYHQTALTAFKEVENALVDLRQRAQQAEFNEQAALNAGHVAALSQQRYQEGEVSYFEVIDAQRLLLGAELTRVQTLNARYAATVELVRALGGNYGK